ncbi:cell division protein CrgA [Luteipulveratus sp. YIM 133132]|uniref:Cell division protein CrgA n=1 Tax=Luteipulveratus flavus TaxID=3031728 RepID=A0ABT6C5A4_9MICO|nr:MULTISPECIES: cell division protein CrgA [unclassified Luteipulveratus]MDE9364411.1 cell division protein CrgA [Luteipulveratus sp. YIM 133132]MDF8263950.1 cell division protein CrgA [Luteipulveratus sp. YIM 133296]
MSTSEEKDRAGAGGDVDAGASKASSETAHQDAKKASAGAKASGTKGSAAKASGAKAAGASKADDAEPAKTSRRGDRPQKVPGGPSSTLFKVVMLGLMVVGLIWIVVFYLANGKAPIPGISYGNLAIGFALIMVGFAMTTRWR